MEQEKTNSNRGFHFITKNITWGSMIDSQNYLPLSKKKSHFGTLIPALTCLVKKVLFLKEFVILLACNVTKHDFNLVKSYLVLTITFYI